MNATIQFTCPHCQRQMNFPAAAAGQQGKCGGCQQIVMIQPNLQSAAPAGPPALPSSSSAINPPTLPSAIVVAQDPKGSRGNTDFAMIPGGGSTALTRTKLSSDAKKKIIIFVAAGGGGLAFLGFVLLVVVLLFFLSPGVDQSSPEDLARSVFNVVKSDDRKAFIGMLPDVEVMEALISNLIQNEALSEREAEELERKFRSTDFSADVSKIRRKGIDAFNDLVKYRDWQDADIVTVVSEGRRHVGEFASTEHTFLVFELGTELHVLVVRDSVRIGGVWYFDGDKLNVFPLSDMRTADARVLRDALQRTNDSHRNRILEEMPR